MTESPQRGVILGNGSNPQGSIRSFLQGAAEKKLFDAIMLPMRVPSQDSYAWIMISDFSLLAEAVPLAPIMPVNAAKAIKRFTRIGEGEYTIAVLIRPCEVRACIELAKLNQIKQDKLIILSYDCPGALPMQDYIADPKWGEEEFEKLINDKIFLSDNIKPVCKICDKFSLPAGDLHFGFMEDKLLLMSQSEKGKEFITGVSNFADQELGEWQSYITGIQKQRQSAQKLRYSEIKNKVEGFENLLDTFSECIGCHNCQSACPICYCRQCYFDSSASKPNSDLILMRAQQRGGLVLPLDRLMFHTGRMSHMSLSCVSCGLCSDACPVKIPVAEIFSYVGSETQAAFDYTAGASVGEGLPLKEYKPKELGELGRLVNSAEAGEKNHE